MIETNDRNISYPHFVAISRVHLLYAVLGLIGLAGFTIIFFLKVDPDLFFASEKLAMKIGGTVLTIPQFRNLKILAGPQGIQLSEKEFAHRLTETILFAEAARQKGFDRSSSYLGKVKIFDQTIPPASDPQNLMRALFLMEELGNSMRVSLLQKVSNSMEKTDPEPILPASSVVEKLHVRTVQVSSEEDARRVLEDAAAGVTFNELNASWSESLYAPVAGDLGWINPDDLPNGVFAHLLETPVGSMTLGFNDGEGFHLFVIEEKLRTNSSLRRRETENKRLQEKQELEIKDFLNAQKERIPVWINPVLEKANREERN